MKKLALVLNHIDWFWSHRLPLAKGAQEQGWDVCVAVAGAAQDPNLKSQQFMPFDLPKASGLLGAIKSVWAIRQLIKHEKPDVLHAITLKYAFFAGLAGRGQKKVRIVHTLAGLGYLFSGEGFKPKILRAVLRPLLTWALTGPQMQIIFQNRDDMELMIARGFANRKRCTLIRGSGVNLQDFTSTPVPDEKVPLIIMPTRLVHEKGVAVFIEAANQVHHQGYQARFQIAGGLSSSNPSAITEQQMQAMLRGSTVEWLGKVSNMAALYQAASLICYPSYYGEGVPKVLLEAAASGRAIITTDHPGCREVVEDGQNGLLVPVKDTDATARAIIKLLDEPARLHTMGAVSRTIAEAQFDVTQVVMRTLAVYDD